MERDLAPHRGEFKNFFQRTRRVRRPRMWRTQVTSRRTQQLLQQKSSHMVQKAKIPQ